MGEKDKRQTDVSRRDFLRTLGRLEEALHCMASLRECLLPRQRNMGEACG